MERKFVFLFFLSDKFGVDDCFYQLDELKGADANELRTQIDLLLFQAYPRSFYYSILNKLFLTGK